jgi:hypothetical protein
VAAIYALVLIAYRGKITETWTTFKLILHRFVAFGAYLWREDLIDPLMTNPDRRLRVIPYAAMLPIGILGALFWIQMRH